MAMENIETFGKGAQKYGLPVTDIFQSVDLYEGSKGPFLNVINCLNRLGVEVSVHTPAGRARGGRGGAMAGHCFYFVCVEAGEGGADEVGRRGCTLSIA